METVLVTGGTGHLGRDLVRLLKPGHRVRVLARSRGDDPDVEWVRGDLATGAGVAKAVAGVRTVVHAATWSPAARRGYPLPADLVRTPGDVDVFGTRRLLDEAARAGAGHLVYVSIVGVDRSRLPYLRVKREAERLVRAGGVPWSVLRATQFHWLADRMLGRAARMPVLPVPADLETQPVDTADFAAYVAERVEAGPGGQCEDFGGPEVLSLEELVDQWRRFRVRPVRTVRLPVPERAVRAARDLTCPSGRRGTTSWSTWLRARAPE
ncbi:SDR family oxidoreductase [Streptomyces thermolilacinus]|uniref:NAD-dependent epimerase n=1 Tax=Streptomyces thermolilacinus SPC6 TaxID=1306406 RepID=A0A1D3DMB0_9ACTN|nr:NAD(P)H-binding protein [Streptomyces thermolilacinus]OEJ93466.1 NAD-dependent epimerase [Streptomyces thermolilacinus SPC6]